MPSVCQLWWVGNGYLAVSFGHLVYLRKGKHSFLTEHGSSVGRVSPSQAHLFVEKLLAIRTTVGPITLLICRTGVPITQLIRTTGIGN